MLKMSEKADRIRGGWQFTIRNVLATTAVIALAFGWYSSAQHADITIARLSSRLSYAETELDLLIQRAAFRHSAKRLDSSPNGQPPLTDMDGVNLSGTSIIGADSAFQRSCFDNGDLRYATLKGDASSFQGAQFNNAMLAGARLTGGVASFQLASFENADLSGAILAGGGSSFQGASVAGAKLIGAQIVCSRTSFQGVNIDGAQFQGADLSALERQSLEGCHFKTPPTYDEKTRFPAEFDPVAQLWKRASK
jgi:uncharacterized protein YjbI with pentapeptide repeats